MPHNALHELVNQARTGGGGDPVKTRIPLPGAPAGITYNPFTGEVFDATGFLLSQGEIDALVAREGQRKLAEAQAERATPTSSFNVSQSLADDRTIQLQRDNLLFDIQEADRRAAQDQRDFDFLREKFDIETEAGQRREARETEALMESIRARVESNNIRREQMAQELRQFERRMAFEQAIEANRQQVEAREQQRADVEQQRGIARDIASFAQNPGGVGANAAFLTAGGADPISQAIATGQEGFTDQSLLPLDILLQQQEAMQQRLLNPPQQNVQPTQPEIGGEAGIQKFDPRNLDPNTSRIVDNGVVFINPFSGQEIFTPGVPSHDPEGNVIQYLRDEGEEPGPGVVFAQNGFSGVVDDPTVFVAGEGSQPESVNIQPIEEIQQPQAPSRARDFLNRSLQLALQNSPFGGVPTPVGVSAPGTSPFLQQMAASIAALRGINPQLFFNELMRVQPTGISEGVTRRV